MPCLVDAPLDSCLEGTIIMTTTGPGAITETPAPGRFYWFLVTSDNGSGEGPSGSVQLGGSSQPRIRNTSGSCPVSCAQSGGACSTSSDCCSADCGAPCAAQCCLPTGALCAQSSDCCSDMCLGGACQPCRSLGQSCTSSATCCSGNCSLMTCVAACQPNGANCAANTDCCSSLCSGGTCQTCTSVGGPCTLGSQCCSGTCTGNTCQSCVANGFACVAGSQCCSGVCSGNQCVPLVCTPPLADCDHNPQNGCETNTSNDPGNCGSCGHVCPGGNGTPSCSAGQCQITCNPGYLNCNMQVNDGCEVNDQIDSNNCGGCGFTCGPVPNAQTTFCSGGTCQLTCSPGYLNCNFQYNDGCEVNPQIDRNNCGTCGHACAAGQSCSGGSCVP